MPKIAKNLASVVFEMLTGGMLLQVCLFGHLKDNCVSNVYKERISCLLTCITS